MSDPPSRPPKERPSRIELARRFQIVSELTSDYSYAFVVEPSGEIVPEWATGGFERLTGYSAELLAELGGWEKLILPEDLSIAGRQLGVLLDRRTATVEYRIRTKNGQVRWMRDRARPEVDVVEDRVTRIYGAVQDITERKIAQRALRASERRFRMMAEQSLDAVFVYDLPTQRLSYVSPAVRRITGYSPDELMGMEIAELPTMPQQERVAEAMRKLTQDGVVVGLVLPVRRRDGDEAILEVNASVLVRDGEACEVQGVVRDITQRQSLEGQLRQMQKMEAIGTLAGGIAHDFNNLLTGILGCANLLEIQADDPAKVRQSAEVIERAAARAAELTRQLLGFARQGKLHERAVDLHEVVGEVAALLQRTLDPHIELVQCLQARCPMVVGDPGQLQQVVLNLAVNAGDAMATGGQLSFDTELVELSQERVGVPVGLEPGRYLSLAVSDTGTGIAEADRSRIFEPFFTTKEGQSRTGLGLATVYGIVANHGGAIDVRSELGHGTTFEVWLPAGDVAPESDELPRAEPPSGRGRVLVVDDEGVVREVASRMLAELGYHAHCVSSAEQAVEYYREHRHHVHLVLVDLIMPGMGGGECYRQLRRIDPAVRVVLSTGHALEGEAQALLDEGMVGFIQKPYLLADLAYVVERAMGHDAG